MNGTDILTDYTYNLSLIASDAIITQPHNWLADVNAKLLFLPMFSLLGIFGITLFFIMNGRQDTSQAESGAFAGVITCFVGLLLFAIEGVNGIKLFSWVAFTPFIFITVVFIFVHMASKRM